MLNFSVFHKNCDPNVIATIFLKVSIQLIIVWHNFVFSNLMLQPLISNQCFWFVSSLVNAKEEGTRVLFWCRWKWCVAMHVKDGELQIDEVGLVLCTWFAFLSISLACQNQGSTILTWELKLAALNWAFYHRNLCSCHSFLHFCSGKTMACLQSVLMLSQITCAPKTVLTINCSASNAFCFGSSAILLEQTMIHAVHFIMMESISCSLGDTTVLVSGRHKMDVGNVHAIWYKDLLVY